MKQLELFDMTPEEKKYLEMIHDLEIKTEEVDLLKYELSHLKTRLEENVRELDIRLDPFDDFCGGYHSYDEESDHISSTSQDYLLEKSDIDFKNMEVNENTKIH